MRTKEKIKVSKDKSTTRVMTFRERMRAKGFVIIYAWVPAKYLQKVKDFIKGLK